MYATNITLSCCWQISHDKAGNASGCCRAGTGKTSLVMALAGALGLEVGGRLCRPQLTVQQGLQLTTWQVVAGDHRRQGRQLTEQHLHAQQGMHSCAI